MDRFNQWFAKNFQFVLPRPVEVKKAMDEAKPSPTPTQAAKRSRFPKIVVGTYLAWGLLQFFGSLGSNAHSWWPVTLYPMIWPLSMGIEDLTKPDLFFSDPAMVPAWYWIADDYILGCLYIAGGSAWLWLISTLLSKCALLRPRMPFK